MPDGFAGSFRHMRRFSACSSSAGPLLRAPRPGRYNSTRRSQPGPIFYLSRTCTWPPVKPGAPFFLSITWSLAVEEQFYLILPAIVRISSTKTLTWLAAAAFLAAPATRIFLYASGNHYFGPYVLLPCRADALACGLLIAILMRNQVSARWAHGHTRALRSVFAVFAFGVIPLSVVRTTYSWPLSAMAGWRFSTGCCY